MARYRLAIIMAAMGISSTAHSQSPGVEVPAFAGFDSVLVEDGAQASPRLWGQVDYLLWWMKPVCEPPATVSVGNPADAKPGAVGQPGTITVMGKTRFEFPVASGVRPTLGLWFDDQQSWGLFASGIIVPRISNTRTFTTAPNGPPAYLNYVSPTGEAEAIPFAIPGVVRGFASEKGSSGLWGVEINTIAQAKLLTHTDVQARGGFILGGRYMLLEDQVVLSNTQTLVAAPFTSAAGENRFTTRNQFLGPQFGFQIGADYGRCEFEFTQKLAIGVTKMENTISGGPLVSGSQLVPGSLPGPLLAMPSNNFRMTTSRATLLPEINAKMRYRINDHLKLSLGYNFLYWSRIFCPGDLMDPRVNLTQLPEFGPLRGTAFPTQSFARTDYFAQGLELGLQLEY